MPWATRTSAAARLSVRIWSIPVWRSSAPVRPCRAPLTSSPVPSRLVRMQRVAGPRAALAQQAIGMGRTDDRQAVLRLRIADRVTPGERPAGLADLRRGPVEHLGQDVPRQLLGECRDRQGEQHAAAHREHVTHRVRRRDLAERPGVVDQRREEVERADDRQVVADPVHGGVVGWVQAGDQRIGLGGPRRDRRAHLTRRSAPSLAAHPPQSVRVVRRRPGTSAGSVIAR